MDEVTENLFFHNLFNMAHGFLKCCESLSNQASGSLKDV